MFLDDPDGSSKNLKALKGFHNALKGLNRALKGLDKALKVHLKFLG